MRAQLFKKLDINRHARVLHASRGNHVASAEQGAVTVESRQHRREQPRQCEHVGLAVVEQGGALIAGPRPAPQRQLSHVVLLGAAHRIKAIVHEGTEEPSTSDHLAAVSRHAELREEVEDICWHLPPEREVTPDFSTAVVTNDAGFGIGRVGCAPPTSQFVLPHAPGAARREVPSHAANRPWPLAGRRHELEVHEHQPAKQPRPDLDHVSPRSCRITR